MGKFEQKRALNILGYRRAFTDGILMAIGLYLALWLRVGGDDFMTYAGMVTLLLPGAIVIRLFSFYAFGVYRSLWRYTSLHDATYLVGALLFSVPLASMLSLVVHGIDALPRPFFVIDAMVDVVLLFSVRVIRRITFEMKTKNNHSQMAIGKMIIYGAGLNGRLLAQRLLSDPTRDRDVLGFIDDDPQKIGKQINKLPVLGSSIEMEEILEHSGCTELVVAITEPSAALMRNIVLLCRKLNIRVQRIAHFEATKILSRGEALYRQVELRDLMNRPPAEIDLPSIKGLLSGKVVLVTGAGGSIGSELCRQIQRFSPAKLLLLDHSELALYEVDRSLRPKTNEFLSVVPLLVDIKDERSLNSAFNRYKPDVVFHAAAYKHVHLVEANVGSSVANNITGTKNLLKACEAHGVSKFVMISSDKAVNPVGAMGATKRICEMLTSRAAARTSQSYSAVRFGNVLGSSGSLIPLLKEQIEAGGPVQLTHQDMSRYFMLIPEAVSLVLMSATLSQPGDINVLKMGDPIKILDLAKSLIALMGRNEDDIGIVFTGVRPGEKMFEELYLTGAELKTRHSDILTVPQETIDQNLDSLVESLEKMAIEDDPYLLRGLLSLANRCVDDGFLNESYGDRSSGRA